ncbi:hypothetical protein L486_01210 [Kwoniella mangroviensis CBS 10435]|uniref:Major facilitator superfamily (MFS) profile domain-containing protein n=1 Tax=Kwoniella mangroviensis CBS 10435 TaxID=1331196 RepID=A0A1B9J1A8_9TREE|nr:hypothetical protein L486_01210 [Kwoniella mangroviensis CBS 10435]
MSSSTRPTLRPNPSLPSHLKPPHAHTSSQSQSRSSTPTPHNQQHNYVPSFDDVGLSANGINERALFSEHNTPIPSPLPQTPEDPFNGNGTVDDAEDDVPEWRKPSPRWLYPFILGVPLCIGMSIAPKAELFVNLACLAHPPSATKDSTGGHHLRAIEEVHINQAYNLGIHNYVHTPLTKGDQDQTLVPLPVDRQIQPQPQPSGNISIGDDYVLSPADKWFLKLQHDIYQYHLHHPSNNSSKNSPVPSGRPIIVNPPGPEPSEPLPKPDEPLPSDRDDDKDHQGQSPVPSDDKDGGKQDHRQYEEIDPRLCKKDPKVQAAAAKLTMLMTLTMGLLSALTTGFWGQTSDKLGRTKIIAFVEIGLLLNEICFIVVANFPYLVPGGYRALLLGPTIEGLLGGYSTISATLNAYVSDITPDGSRVTLFARISGMFMAGFALGPVLGSMLITWSGDIMTPFYVNAIIYTLYIPLIVFLLPESLSSQARLQLAKNAKLAKEEAKKRDQLEREWENETPFPPDGVEGESDPLLSGWSRISNNAQASKARKRTIGNFRRLMRKVFGFLQPLSIFIPVKKEGERHRDWNLTVVGAGLFFMSMVFGIMAIKAQFTFYAYGWTSAQLGPYMSVTAFSRSFVLIVLVPVVMHYVKPRFLANEKDSNAIANPTIEEEVIEDPTSSAITANSTSSNPAKPKQPQRSAHLDLLTVRIALALETVPYLLLALSPSPMGFVVLSMLLTLGGPSNPAANSLALSLLPDSNQSGRLFGALSVLHALGANLISPLMFGTVFASTVGTYAPTIFAIAAGSLILAQICMAFVRLDRHKSTGSGSGVEEDLGGRGRSRRVKRVSSSSFSVGGSGSGVSRFGGGGGGTYGAVDDNGN